MRLSKRMSVVKPSATMAVTEKAAVLRARGVEVLGLGAGEPDFETAPHICEAARRAMELGETRYTPVGGTAVLKDAIRTKLERDNDLLYEPGEVMASCGGKHALYLMFQALFGEGEDVLVPGPFWVSYPDMLALAGAQPRVVRTRPEDGFKLSPEILAAALRPETRAVILNAPSNPTGVAYDAGELAELADVLAGSDAWIICDDVYEMIAYDGLRRTHLLQLRPELRERTLVVNSVSKTYAMTGWRLGYTAGPREVIRAMSTLQGQMTSNPCSIAQAAAVAALAGPQAQVPAMVQEFERRRDFVVQRLNEIPGVRCSRPRGAFYVFPNVGDCLRPDQGLRSGDDLAAALIEKVHVALVGGTDFGYADHVRISYATSMEILREALDRVDEALQGDLVG